MANTMASIFVTPSDKRDWAMLGHVRGWCHDGAICPICAAEQRAWDHARRANDAERRLESVISGTTN